MQASLRLLRHSNWFLQWSTARVQNSNIRPDVHLARLWSAKKFLMVEGKDMDLLRQFHSLVFPDAQIPLDGLPSFPVGGWGGWSYAIGSSMALKNSVGEQITGYCVLDTDYHTAKEKMIASHRRKSVA